jgi:hypothetical protein
MHRFPAITEPTPSVAWSLSGLVDMTVVDRLPFDAEVYMIGKAEPPPRRDPRGQRRGRIVAHDTKDRMLPGYAEAVYQPG